MNPVFIIFRCAALLLLLVGAMSRPAAADDQFPEYPWLKPNVAFWKKVYSQYPTSKGLIHDRQNLAIIYEVISLAGDAARPGGAPDDERAVAVVKERYRQLLLALAQGRPPASSEEKRVADLFGPTPTAATLRAAADDIRFQRCLSDRFQAGLVRSGRYLEQIKDIFNQHGLPSDLAYLPHVESSFDYEAYSKSGAAGIWQLMPATGRRFLTINSALDERRDPILASHAAAKFLAGNFRKLQSWPLALTAYNHGLTSMLRAKNSWGSYENICQRYDNANFGFASRNFYAEFLAARDIAKNYRQHFAGLRLDDPVQTRTFTVNSRASIKTLANHYQVDSATLAQLNPALRQPVLAGRQSVPKGYRLRVPQTATTHSRLADLPAKPEPASGKKRRAQSHRVKAGETIVKIAERYGLSPQALLSCNQLDRRALITVGQTLRIPAAAAKGNKTKVKPDSQQ